MQFECFRTMPMADELYRGKSQWTHRASDTTGAQISILTSKLEFNESFLISFLQRFLARDNENMHQKLAQFLYDLLGKTGTVVWTQGVITILKLCSENGVTVIFAARIAVKLFEALAKLVYCVKRDALANMALDAQAHANQVRFLADRCSGMVDILITCLKYKKTSSIVAQALFPSMQRKAYMLQIDRIGELFCGKCKDFNLQAVTTLKLLVNRGENMDVQQRVLAICTSPAVIQHFERVMQESTWKRLTRLTYELAIDIQEWVCSAG